MMKSCEICFFLTGYVSQDEFLGEGGSSEGDMFVPHNVD
jgi:hypothetical protein